MTLDWNASDGALKKAARYRLVDLQKRPDPPRVKLF
jgi:hypothetical protein